MSDSDTHTPSLGELFIAFASISIMGFGGVMPWAHWMSVEKRRWLTPRQFSSTLALCQSLPGANILNFAVVTGRRFHGAAGAAVSIAALLLVPFFLVITLATFYAAYSELPGLSQALRGVGAAGGGLVAALAAKMAVSLDRNAIVYGAAALAFISVGLLRFPLVVTVLVLMPLLALYFWKRV
jgi:chromate transporter